MQNMSRIRNEEASSLISCIINDVLQATVLADKRGVPRGGRPQVFSPWRSAFGHQLERYRRSAFGHMLHQPGPVNGAPWVDLPAHRFCFETNWRRVFFLSFCFSSTISRSCMVAQYGTTLCEKKRTLECLGAARTPCTALHRLFRAGVLTSTIPSSRCLIVFSACTSCSAPCR